MSGSSDTDGSASTPESAADEVEAPKAEPTRVPLEALQGEREKRQALEKRLAEMERQQQEAERKRAEEQGEYKRLYEETLSKLETTASEYEATRSKYQQMAERQAARLQARLDALPEGWRELIPDGLEQAELEAQVERVERRVAALADQSQAPKPAGTGPRAGGSAGDPHNLTPPEREWWEAQSFYNPDVGASVVKRLYARAHKAGSP